jgi:hypothetical protein
MVAAGLQCHVGAGTGGTLSGLVQGIDFRMPFAGTLVPAFTDDLPVPDQHTTHPRIGIGCVQPARREPQGTCHELVVSCSKHVQAGTSSGVLQH